MEKLAQPSSQDRQELVFNWLRVIESVEAGAPEGMLLSLDESDQTAVTPENVESLKRSVLSYAERYYVTLPEDMPQDPPLN